MASRLPIVDVYLPAEIDMPSLNEIRPRFLEVRRESDVFEAVTANSISLDCIYKHQENLISQWNGGD